MISNGKDISGSCEWCNRFSILLADRVDGMMKDNFFSFDFPVHCVDNEAPCGCDIDRMKKVFFGETDLSYDETIDNPTESKIFLIVEFLYNHCSEPTKYRYHSFFSHVDIVEASKELGQQKFSTKINSLFNKLNIPFTINSGKVIKRGNEIFEKVIDPNIFNTEDELTNNLLRASINFFKEVDGNNRSIALEKLWDAWERIKTLEGVDKRSGVEKLLSRGIANDVLRKHIDNEAKILTDIGNQFQIRHFETDKIKLNEEDVDYLYYRLFNLILRLLAGTGRLLSS